MYNRPVGEVDVWQGFPVGIIDEEDAPRLSLRRAHGRNEPSPAVDDDEDEFCICDAADRGGIGRNRFVLQPASVRLGVDERNVLQLDIAETVLAHHEAPLSMLVGGFGGVQTTR